MVCAASAALRFRSVLQGSVHLAASPCFTTGGPCSGWSGCGWLWFHQRGYGDPSADLPDAISGQPVEQS